MVKRGLGHLSKQSRVSSYDDPSPQMLSQELKYVDTTISFLPVLVAGNWLKIAMPAQGATSTTRVADRAYLTKLEFTGFRYSTVNDGIRIVILQTKGLFTTPPATTDVFTSAVPYAPYVYNARDLYEIVYDSHQSIVNGGDSNVHFYKDALVPRVRDMKFVSGSTNPYNGQLYLLAISVNPSNTNLLGTIRIWFEDSN